MSRSAMEPGAWAAHRQRTRPEASSQQTLYFSHSHGRRQVAIHGAYIPARDEWHLRVLVNRREVETKVSTSAFADALSLLTTWRDAA